MGYKKKNLTKEITRDRKMANNPPILIEISEFMSYSLLIFGLWNCLADIGILMVIA